MVDGVLHRCGLPLHPGVPHPVHVCGLPFMALPLDRPGTCRHNWWSGEVLEKHPAPREPIPPPDYFQRTGA